MKLRSASLFASIFGLVFAFAVHAGEMAKVDLSELRMLDVRGGRHVLAASDIRGTAFVFLSTECPISRQYIPELNRLAKTAADRKLAFYGVVSDSSVTRADAVKVGRRISRGVSRVVRCLARTGRFVQARSCAAGVRRRLAGRCSVRAGGSTILYADIDKRRTEPSRRDLLDAMTAVADGKTVATPRTEAVGCPFETPKGKEASAQVTYARDIAPILFANCAECHRPGEVAPFSLLTYQDAAKRAKGLARVTERRLMPPWRADVHYGQFLDERRMTEREIALVKAWAESGAPEGNAADLPPQPKFPSGWRLGTPDLVVSVPVRYTVPADGPDIFQHFVMPLNLAKDEQVVAFEFRPGNPSVVHHAIVAIDTRGGARARDAETPEPGWRTSGLDRRLDHGNSRRLDSRDDSAVLSARRRRGPRQERRPGRAVAFASDGEGRVRPVEDRAVSGQEAGEESHLARPVAAGDVGHRNPAGRVAVSHRFVGDAARRLHAELGLSAHAHDRQGNEDHGDAARQKREAVDLDQGLELLTGRTATSIANR